ncbi:hypothetical protein EON65_36470 [archaeon]|nr:MAG: hypothetical protein EON65_36470 [archaeon]
MLLIRMRDSLVREDNLLPIIHCSISRGALANSSLHLMCSQVKSSLSTMCIALLMQEDVTSSAGAGLGDVVRCNSLNEVSGEADLSTLSHSGQSSLSARDKFRCLRGLGRSLIV